MKRYFLISIFFIAIIGIYSYAGHNSKTEMQAREWAKNKPVKFLENKGQWTDKNILFQTERKDMLMREAWRILREGGRLAMIEWDTMVESQVMLGPLPAMRVKKETARTLAVQAGFEFDREFSAGAHHYGMLFIK